MQRRNFLSAALAIGADAAAQSPQNATSQPGYRVPSGEDRLREPHSFAFSVISFKVATQETTSGLFVIEHKFRQKGGPPRHLHPYQDEWFYIIEGEFLFEIGKARLTLRSGDSVLGPRKVPHVWACAGDGQGKMLISFAPAGKMEAFFRDIAKGDDALPSVDAAVMHRKYDLELIGPPLAV